MTDCPSDHNSSGHCTFMQARTADFGIGAQLALFGFRACARGRSTCMAVRRAFEAAFDELEGTALDAMLGFTRAIGTAGRRPVVVAAPGCPGVTHDEGTILSLLEAAQAGRTDHTAACLHWLLARPACPAAILAGERVAAVFLGRSIAIRGPEIELSAPRPAASSLRVIEGGRVRAPTPPPKATLPP